MADIVADGAVDDPPEAAPRPRARVVIAVLVVLVLVAVAARGTDGAAVEEVLSIPPAGTVRPDVLGNGTPVFVVHTVPLEGGEPVVDVIQAFTPEVEGPITELVGWCAPSQQFVAAHHGPLYDYRGRRTPSATVGRLPFEVVSQDLTALDDLIHRTSQVIDGRVAEDEPVRIGGVQQLQPWQDAARPVLRGTVPPDACRLGAEDGRVVDHGFLRGRLTADRGGWQVADGWLVVAPDGSASWCDEEPVVGGAGPAASCGAPRDDVAIGFAFDPADVGSTPVVIGGPLAARLSGGVVQRVAVLPSSAWRGSSLQGVEVVEGRIHPDGARLEGERWTAAVAASSARGACAARWATTDGRTRIPVADGALTTSEPGTPHRIEVDAVTCRAIAIRPA